VLYFTDESFLANVNSRSLYVIGRPSVCLSSVVCNVRAPYWWAMWHEFYCKFLGEYNSERIM